MGWVGRAGVPVGSRWAGGPLPIALWVGAGLIGLAAAAGGARAVEDRAAGAETAAPEDRAGGAETAAPEDRAGDAETAAPEDQAGDAVITAPQDRPAAGASPSRFADEPDPLFDDDFFDEELDASPSGYPDPLEESNRGVFAFNRQVDRWILDPVTRAYRWAVPKPARNAIARFFINLGSTKTLVNDFLQLEWRDAGVTTTRLVINTSVGIGGLFDVADRIGLAGHDSDFGQTLALAGTPSGPYIVLPILGPANVRDGLGTVVDGFFQPTYYILGPSNLIIGPTEILLYSGSSGLSTYERRYQELKALEESSVDFYAALRSGYYQDRVGQIWGRREDHRTSEEPRYGDDDEGGAP